VPWNVKGKVELRLEFVRRVVVAGEPISRLCEEYGISRPTGYLWLRRYQETGKIQSLVDRSHRPKTCPNRTDEAVETRVIELRSKYGWGADKLKVLLSKEGIEVPRVTINRIIHRNGLLIEEDCSKPALKRFEKNNPNEMWQVDLKGCMGRGSARCEPLSILDDHSRFVVGLFPTRTSKLEPIQAAFQETFEKYGVPDALLMDHGVPWWGNAHVTGLTKLSVWLMKQDIKLKFSGYNHPQTQGKVERFHRTLAHAVRHKGTPTRFEKWSPLLSTIKREYNHIRPHEALNMDVPASRYLCSKRGYNPTPKPPEYPSHSTVIRLDHLGRFRYRGLRLFASEALADELIRVEELQRTAVIFYRNTPIREVSLTTGQSSQFVQSLDT
jgi:transposase InsO family protein